MIEMQRGTPARIALLALLATTISTATEASQPTRPNIVLILADDLGWRDLGCFGSTIHPTPHLDRLAKQGMRFTSAYTASSVCSPTRASIMTGKYPARIDLTIWLGGRGGAPAVDHLALSETTIAEALAAGGYFTGHVGKWHLGGAPYHPQHQGFAVNIAGNHTGTPAGGYYLPNRMDLPGAEKGDYLTDRLTDEGLKIIEEGVRRKRPFFLYQAYHSVHTPIQGKPELVDRYADEMQRSGRTFNAQYAAMIHSLDEGVGRITAKLDELEIADNTVVIFFSDNGGFSHSGGRKNNVTDNSPLRRGKGYSYEGGHRVPMIVRFPPITKPGSVSNIPVISTDFYPTLLELAGLDRLPKQHVDGVSIVPALKNGDAELDREAIYWHYPHNSPQGGTPSGAVRVGDWKLIEFFDDGRVELYNLANDLSEQNDLAAKMPQRVEQMHEQLKAWRKSVSAKLPP